jgi:hypothetical protein
MCAQFNYFREIISTELFMLLRYLTLTWPGLFTPQGDFSAGKASAIRGWGIVDFAMGEFPKSRPRFPQPARERATRRADG